MRPDRDAPPFPFLLNLGVRVVDEFANQGECLAPPVSQFLDPLCNVLRSTCVARATFFRCHDLPDASSMRRQKKYERPQMTLLAADGANASGPSPMER